MPVQTTINDFDEGGTTHPDLTTPKTNGPSDYDIINALGALRNNRTEKAAFNKKTKMLRQHFMNLGLNLAALDMTLDEEDREDGTTRENLEEFLRYARIAKLPIGSQIDLFAGPESAAAAVDGLELARLNGYQDGVAGKTADEQRYQAGTQELAQYLLGHDEGQQVLRDIMEKSMNEGLAAEKAKAAEKEAKQADKLAKAREKADKLAEKAADLKAKADAAAEEANG